MKLSAEEVLSIAQKIESNAIAFYKKAADMYPAYKDTFADLEEMEDGHRRFFASMQDGLDEEDRSRKSPDPFSELGMYLDALADTHGGEGRPAEINSLTGQESASEIVARAVDLEKESILYYVGLKDVIRGENGREHLEKIIEEEKRHVVILKKIAEELSDKE